MKTLLMIAWLSGIGADAATTHYGLLHGAHERVLTQSPLVNDGLAGGQAVGGVFVLTRLYCTHPKTALMLGLIMGVGHSYIAVHNLQAIHTKH